mmetsp:Transcript_67556/g.198391  ORF Transcript_67556/g.198391 Transcript_67556/m.198391 type:complete len:232 (+) Transcript_67556:156-851(+)
MQIRDGHERAMPRALRCAGAGHSPQQRVPPEGPGRGRRGRARHGHGQPYGVPRGPDHGVPRRAAPRGVQGRQRHARGGGGLLRGGLCWHGGAPGQRAGAAGRLPRPGAHGLRRRGGPAARQRGRRAGGCREGCEGAQGCRAPAAGGARRAAGHGLRGRRGQAAHRQERRRDGRHLGPRGAPGRPPGAVLGPAAPARPLRREPGRPCGGDSEVPLPGHRAGRVRLGGRPSLT